METGSRLARQVAFKKKLEEEYMRREKYVRDGEDCGEVAPGDQASKGQSKQEKARKESNKKNIEKRKEYKRRIAKFTEMKKKRLEAKKRINEEEKWKEDLEFIIKDNQTVLKGLENYKVRYILYTVTR